MAKKESSLKNMLMTLLVISLAASLALGGVYNLTREPIAAAVKAKQEMAIRAVVPEFDSLAAEKIAAAGTSDSLTYVRAYKQGKQVAIAIESISRRGYDSTPIKVMIGILPDGKINNIAVVQQKETPGLGTKMAEPKFKDEFNGKDPSTFKFKVKKDGGDVDAISAATISSRAFCDAVALAYKTLEEKGQLP
jgi:electron transport complex protein RnfG